MGNAKTWVTLGWVGMIALSLSAVAGIYTAPRGVASLFVAGLMAAACLALLLVFRRMEQELKKCKEEVTLTQEKELRRSRAFTLGVMDSLPHAVALISPGGQIEMANARAATFGLEAGKDLNTGAEPWLKALTEKVKTSRAPSGPLDGTALVQKFEEGREQFFAPQATPLMDGKGNLESVLIVLVDVTSARRAEEAKSDLMSTFSHELKTPMTSLQMSIYLLIDDAASRLTPRQLDLLKAAREDADRLHRLVEDVLAAAREKL